MARRRVHHTARVEVWCSADKYIRNGPSTSNVEVAAPLKVEPLQVDHQDARQLPDPYRLLRVPVGLALRAEPPVVAGDELSFRERLDAVLEAHFACPADREGQERER